MKVGILTFHDAANYGAVLQAHGLQAFLAGKGMDCECLDYRNACRRRKYAMGWQAIAALRRGRPAEAIKYVLGAPFMALRRRRFAAFRAEHLRIGAQELRTIPELAAVVVGYDRLVVGSDQVWNPAHNGADSAFLLDFDGNPRCRIAYAASFGVAALSADLREVWGRGLRGIGRISVRERDGVRLVRELSGRDAEVALDPVFLPGRGHWDALAGPRTARERPFVFAYTNRLGQAERFFRQTGWPMRGRVLRKLARQTSPTDFVRPGVEVAYAIPPVAFLRSVRDAELVLTASFHCLAFAILFNTPFVCFLTGDPGKDERPAGLLSALGLEARIFRPDMVLADAEAPIDWEQTNARLDALAERSRTWLLDALEGR